MDRPGSLRNDRGFTLVEAAVLFAALAVVAATGTEEAKNAVSGGMASYYVDDFPAYGDNANHFDDFVIRPSILTVVTRAEWRPCPADGRPGGPARRSAPGGAAPAIR